MCDTLSILIYQIFRILINMLRSIMYAYFSSKVFFFFIFSKFQESGLYGCLLVLASIFSNILIKESMISVTTLETGFNHDYWDNNLFSSYVKYIMGWQFNLRTQPLPCPFFFFFKREDDFMIKTETKIKRNSLGEYGGNRIFPWIEDKNILSSRIKYGARTKK